MDTTGGIREHLQEIVFLFVAIYSGFKSFFIFPERLPFLFNIFWYVLLFHGNFLSCLE